MKGYEVYEDAVVSKFIGYFDELDDKRCMAADVDAVVNNMLLENSKFGCYVDFNGGSDEPRKAFNTSMWAWSMVGIFLIRFSDTIEDDLRTIVNKLSLAFAGDHTLGGITPFVHLISIGVPESGDINDTPYYFLPFVIEVIDR
jgi:hypothetical protein